MADWWREFFHLMLNCQMFTSRAELGQARDWFSICVSHVAESWKRLKHVSYHVLLPRVNYQ